MDKKTANKLCEKVLDNLIEDVNEITQDLFLDFIKRGVAIEPNHIRHIIFVSTTMLIAKERLILKGALNESGKC